MPALRNQRRELFAQGLAQGKTANAAYIDAGYRPNRHNASRLKTNETIVARVAELQTRRRDRFVLTRQHLIERLLENIENALGRKPVNVGKEGAEIFVYRGDVANNAIRLAGLEIGMFNQRKELKLVADFDKYSDAELVQLLAQEAQTLLLSDQSGDGDD
jgi:phage terminase small subunit